MAGVPAETGLLFYSVFLSNTLRFGISRVPVSSVFHSYHRSPGVPESQQSQLKCRFACVS